MNSRERLLGALQREPIDRLPVTTHHIQPYFLDTYLPETTRRGFFELFGADAIEWIYALCPPEGSGYYDNPHQKSELGFLEGRMVASDEWMITKETQESRKDYLRERYTISTPSGKLTTVLESNGYTSWVAEHLIKERRDIEIIGKHVTYPACDHAQVREAASSIGDRGIVRGLVPSFDIYGQPGCWQDACCLVGVEKMIMATFDDPQWVHSLLGILMDRKLSYVKTLRGAPYDIHELGGGDGSTTIISPAIFRTFVAPYDTPIIEALHDQGQRVVYHTCGGMMPILEDIADMGPDAMETFTPAGMGGDADLSEAKRRIGHRVCMIGGFDQGEFFHRSTPEQTRQEVRRCFEQAGGGSGFILCPSDHFFDASIELLQAFFDEARRCLY